jgi:iron complex transport system substrate-binding protein
MRIVSLEPFVTELVQYFGCEEQLVALSHICANTALELPRVTQALFPIKQTPALEKLVLEDCLASFRVDLQALKVLKPELILTSLPFERAGKELEEALSRALTDYLGSAVLLRSVAPVTFDQVLEGYEKIALLLGVKDRGLALSQRIKAQSMDWADNFYDRMKNKRVTFISSVAPLKIAGRWISDMIKMCSAQSQSHSIDREDQLLDWQEIVQFRPDVIVVSPRGATMQETLKSFKAFEKLADWEKIPAVKRGEVVFTSGIGHFHTPGPHLIESMGILVSAIAGFESGYITVRDSFFRLRWLEMQRHRY